MWALFGCVEQVLLWHSRQRVCARLEAPTRPPLSAPHAFVLVEFAQAVLKILGVKVAKTYAGESGAMASRN